MRLPFRRPRPLFPPLGADGHVTDAGQYAMWHIAAWLPNGRAGEVMDLLAANGIEVYRAWPVRQPGETLSAAQDRAGRQMTSCEVRVAAGHD